MLRTAFVFLALLCAGTAGASEAAWAALRAGGAVALIRHAQAPGAGDPPGFRLGDCRTQRNLSEAGRDQASRLGARFRAEMVPVTEVRSGRWCRALDTASLAFPAVIVTPDAALDSFFGTPNAGHAQTRRVRAAIESWNGRQPTLVMVTHQVNITALTGLSAAEGEVVVLQPKPGGFDVAGRVSP